MQVAKRFIFQKTGNAKNGAKKPAHGRFLLKEMLKYDKNM